MLTVGQLFSEIFESNVQSAELAKKNNVIVQKENNFPRYLLELNFDKELRMAWINVV